MNDHDNRKAKDNIKNDALFLGKFSILLIAMALFHFSVCVCVCYNRSHRSLLNENQQCKTLRL